MVVAALHSKQGNLSTVSIIELLVASCSLYTASNELPLATNNCTCNFIYQCTVTGRGGTVWQGSVFHCDDSDGSLTLLHSQFASEIERECNGGDVVARAISVNGSNYTSQLSLTVTPEMNKKTVECAYDNGSSVSVVNTTTVVFATGTSLYTHCQCHDNVVHTSLHVI